jgi:hypothetical protein
MTATSAPSSSWRICDTVHQRREAQRALRASAQIRVQTMPSLPGESLARRTVPWSTNLE